MLQSSPTIGRVLELLVRNDSNRLVTHASLQHLEFLPSRHHTLRLPRLTITEQKTVVGPSVSIPLSAIHRANATFQDVICVVNVQHDCASAECAKTTNEAIRQEREVSMATRKILRHSETNMYILNTHSIHNYRDIHGALPADLPVRSRPFNSAADVRAAAVATMARKKQDAAQAKIASASALTGGTVPAPTQAGVAPRTNVASSSRTLPVQEQVFTPPPLPPSSRSQTIGKRKQKNLPTETPKAKATKSGLHPPPVSSSVAVTRA